MAEIDLAQALGFLSFGLGISTFYQKNDRHLKILMLVFNLNHLLHFLLLGSMLSALSALLSALRTTTSIFTSSKWVAAIFILIGIVSGLGMAEHWWETMANCWDGNWYIFTVRIEWHPHADWLSSRGNLLVNQQHTGGLYRRYLTRDDGHHNEPHHDLSALSATIIAGNPKNRLIG